MKSITDFIHSESPLIIAEIAQAHDGSLGTAHAYIDAVADAGVNAVKFQTHIAAAESTPGEPWRVKFSPQDNTRYDYWQRMEFSKDQWMDLKCHSDERNLFFLSSPFSCEAVDLLQEVGVAAWKIASGETTNTPMFEQMSGTGLPFLISTGMSTLDEIDSAVELVGSLKLPYAVLQCTSMYPTPPEKIGLNIIPLFKERYKCPIGLSDHSGTIYAPLAAVAMGATIIEVHVAFHRKSFGPDVPASLTLEELAHLVQGVQYIHKMRLNPIDKDVMADDLDEMRRLFTKSIVARMDLPIDTILQEEHLTLKKPGTGIPAAQLHTLIGKKLRKPLQKDELITEKALGK
jgi:N,N'-diacetyllegionaminate synthase